MDNFVSTFGGWIGIITAVIVGIFAIIGIVNKNSRDLEKVQSDTANDVIKLLKEQVDALSTKVNIQDTDIKTLKQSIDNLKTENRILSDVLQGRDVQTQQFYKDIYASMEIVKHNDKTSEDNSKLLAKLVSLVEVYINSNK